MSPLFLLISGWLVATVGSSMLLGQRLAGHHELRPHAYCVVAAGAIGVALAILLVMP